MGFTVYFQPLVILSKNMIPKDPGVIVGPIANFLGAILNYLFNFVYGFTTANALGISIILLTIIARLFMLPLAFPQQKSMSNMQKVQPEMEKIKKKYGNNKDPEMQRKMNVEIQKLYSQNKINPLLGCLPLVIQMPIFFALFYVMQSSYRFIGVIGDLYYKAPDSIAQTLINFYSNNVVAFQTNFLPLVTPKLSKGMEFSIKDPLNMAKVINQFSPSDWTQLMQSLPDGVHQTMEGLLAQKHSIEYFFGISLVDKSIVLTGGLQNILANLWPGILIPLLTAGTTFLTSYVSNKQSKTKDPTQLSQQRMMLIMMPIMLGVMTAGFPAGVGLYWITSSVFQVVQQILLHRFFMSRGTAQATAAK